MATFGRNRGRRSRHGRACGDGIGGAPEGVITAAALRCLHGEMQGRLVVNDEAQKGAHAGDGHPRPAKIYSADDLAPGKQIVFAASGVTRQPAERRAILRRWPADALHRDDVGAQYG